MKFNTLLRNDRLFLLGQTAPEPQLRRRTRRIMLVALALAVVALLTGSLLSEVNLGFPVLIGLVVLQGTFRWLAWRGTRALTLAPSELLDELQLQQVHSAYRRAYGVTTAALAVLALGVFPFVVFTVQPHPLRIVFLGAFLVLEMMIWMPTAVLAWRLEDEEPDEHPDDAAAVPA
ncbi:hypothetical protein [Streptomyces sp. NPDC048639]|uniref:hypothetical protein n=1 Tax=Streptomyces sp. NPDC048639 TaxID=3365581 RepID=UPI00371A4901